MLPACTLCAKCTPFSRRPACIISLALGYTVCMTQALHVLQLQCGGAEVFGSELTLRQRMNLRGQKVAVFTWEGCTLLVEGQPNVV